MGEHKQYKAVNWRVAADRLTVGEPVELETLPGLWIRPRKYSVNGAAEIKAAQVRALAELRGNAIREIATAFDGAPASDDAAVGLTHDQRLDVAVRVMENATADVVGSVAERRAKVLFGVAEHNFEGEPGTPTAAWVDELMEHEPVFLEVLRIVEEKNRPLAGTTSPKSATSPTGSSTGSDTETTPDSSTTGATP